MKRLSTIVILTPITTVRLLAQEAKKAQSPTDQMMEFRVAETTLWRVK